MMSRISRSELAGRGVCFGREGAEDVLGMRIRGAGESGGSPFAPASSLYEKGFMGALPT